MWFLSQRAYRPVQNKDRCSAVAVIRVSALVGRLRVAFLTFAGRRSRMTGLTASGCVLATVSGLSMFSLADGRDRLVSRSLNAKFRLVTSTERCVRVRKLRCYRTPSRCITNVSVREP